MSKEVMKDSVIKGNADAAKNETNKALSAGMPAKEALDALVSGMNVIAKQFEDAEIYLPQVMVAADAMIGGINVLEPELAKAGKTAMLGKVVIGTIQGDIHDIGKTIVAIMLRGSGFKIFDLGRDVPIDTFWSTAKENDADIVAASALMSSTTLFQKMLVTAGKEEGLYPKVKVLIGGACTTPEWGEEIGATQADNAAEGVYRAREMVGA